MKITKDSIFNVVEMTTELEVPNIEEDSFETVMEMSRFTQSLRPLHNPEKISATFGDIVEACLMSSIIEMTEHIMNMDKTISQRSAILTITQDGSLIRIDPNFESTGFVQGYQPTESLSATEQTNMKKLFSQLIREPETLIRAMEEALVEFKGVLDQRKRYTMRMDVENAQMNKLLKDIEVLDDVGKSEDTPTEEAL